MAEYNHLCNFDRGCFLNNSAIDIVRVGKSGMTLHEEFRIMGLNPINSPSFVCVSPLSMHSGIRLILSGTVGLFLVIRGHS